MTRIPVVLQTAQTDCGPACLSALARWAGVSASLPQVRMDLDPGRDGSSALTLRRAALQWGVELEPVLAEADELIDRIAEVPAPAILHLTRQHYVILEGVDRTGRMRVMDPAVGRRTLSPHDADLSGLVLLARPCGQTIAPPPPAPRPRLLRDAISDVRGRLGGAAGLSALLALGGLGLPIVTALVVDGLFSGSQPGTRWLAVGLALALVMGLMAVSRGLILAALQHRLAGSLSLRAARTLMTRQLRYFERRSVGDLFGRVESAHAIHSLLGVTLLGAALDALLALGYFVALLILDPQLAGLTAVALALSLLVTAWVAHRCAALRREEILVTADSSTHLVDSITGIATLRAYGAETPFLDSWSTLLDRRLVLTRTRARLTAVSTGTIAAITVATPLTILVLAAQSTSLSPGIALGLMALTTATLTPVASLANQVVQAADLRPLLDRIDDLESAQPVPTGGTDPGEIRGAIELQDVRYAYDRHATDVLGPLNSRVEPGTKVGVIGPTGCGKSTLANLLCGLDSPTEGAVLLDGRDLRDLDLNAVRTRVGVVFQDNWMGAGTIREAILAGRDGYDDDRIWAALVHAQLAEEIAVLPQGLETRLGSGGRGLSGGQRQRLALARALLSDPAILILDEATSALDAQTEARVDAVLADLRITRIIITHRMSVLADADDIWVLDRAGRMTDTADRMLAEDGVPVTSATQ